MRLVYTIITFALTFYQSNAYQRPWRPRTETMESSSRTPLGDQLTAHQRIRLHTVADLLREVYKTLAEMRYLDALAIDTGPHDIDIEHCRQQNIGDSVIYLYQILPYVNVSEAGQSGFVFGGQFSDFRDNELIDLSRDPFYSGWQSCGFGCRSEDPYDQNLPYVAPWVTPLTAMGNHEAVILYDANADTIRVVDQLDDASRDPALRNVHTPQRNSPNRNAIDHIPSRPAADFLRDMVLWYHKLDVIPGDDIDYGIEDWEYSHMKTLYQQAGWPHAFDGDAFEVSLARYQARKAAEHAMNEPRIRVERYLLEDDWHQQTIARAVEDVQTAVGEDDIWLAEFNLWWAEAQEAQNLERLWQAEADAKRLCPYGVCSRAADLLALETENLREELEIAWRGDAYGPLRHQVQRRKILLRAWREAEAERYQSSVEAHDLTEKATSAPQPWSRQELVRLQEWHAAEAHELQVLEELWLDQMPITAIQSRQRVLQMIEVKERNLERSLEDIWRLQNSVHWPSPIDSAAISTTCSVVWITDR